MSPALLATGIVVFLSHGLEAVTGFGCTALALPFVTFLLGLPTAKFLLAILAWILALYIALSKFPKIAWRQFFIILSFVGAGMPLGMYAFATLPRGILIKLLGIFVIASSSLQLWKLLLAPALAKRRGEAPVLVKEDAPREGSRVRIAPVYFLLLFLGGIVHGAFASGGPLVVLYASRALPDKGAFRATLTLLWATLNTALIVSFAQSGQFTPETWNLLLVMAPFLVAGIVAGELVHHRVDAVRFSKIVFSTLCATGWIMLLV